MDPTWGWLEWTLSLSAWAFPIAVVGRWLWLKLRSRQWWALVAAPPVAFILICVCSALVKPYFGARAAGLSTECQSRFKALGVAAALFSEANGDRLPRASTWKADLAPYLRATPVSSAVRCPAFKDGGHYAFNVNLSGVKRSEIESPSETVMFFEGNGYDVGGEELIPSGQRHGGRLWVVTADGLTHTFRAGSTGFLRWTLAQEPKQPNRVE